MSKIMFVFCFTGLMIGCLLFMIALGNDAGAVSTTSYGEDGSIIHTGAPLWANVLAWIAGAWIVVSGIGLILDATKPDYSHDNYWDSHA